MIRVLSVSTGRSDHGLLAPVWQAIDANRDLELTVLLTGMQTRDDSGARTALPPGVEALTVGEDLGGDDARKASIAAARIMELAGAALARVMPDIVMVIGDRLDMFPVVAATLPFNLPLAHLHGGEQTFGAIDDRIRHATSKLAHLHFTATADAAMLLSLMGEEAWRITITGAPGLDALRGVPAMTSTEFARVLGVPSVAGLILATVHPETNSQCHARIIHPIITALREVSSPILFTAPNSDPGANEIAKEIELFAARKPNVIRLDTLGTELYANAMRHADVMVGNSSSGLIEAPMFKLPVVNVGSRQQGRLRGDNVIDVAADAAEIGGALRSVLAKKRSAGLGVSPYGDGHAASRIAVALAAIPDRQTLLAKRLDGSAATFKAPWAACK